MHAKSIAHKIEALKDAISALGPCAVAFSAGVDSTLLLALAHEALGKDVVAITASTPAHPARELIEARAFCEQHGIRHIIFEADQLAIPRLKNNPPNRCYLCKRHLLQTMVELATREGMLCVLEGSNADDMDVYRPGFAAVGELGVKSPLADAGMTKAEVREAAASLGLAAHDKPSTPCLLTRFAYGQAVSHEALRMVDEAEEELRRLGVGQLRVRVDGKAARIEVCPEDFALVLDEVNRCRIVEAFKQLGFSHITLDMQGFRSGSFDEALGKQDT